MMLRATERYVEGIEANSLGEVKVAGKADIAVGGENDGSVYVRRLCPGTQ